MSLRASDTHQPADPPEHPARHPPRAGATAARQRGDGLRAVVLAVLAAAVAAGAWSGIVPRWPGLPHLVALPPLDLFADMRVLVAESTGWGSLAVGTVVAVAVRVVVLALLLGGLDRARLGFALRFYLAVLPLALVAGLASFVGHAGLYAGLHWVGTGMALLALVVLGPAAWTGERSVADGVRTTWRAGLRAGPVLVYVAALAALGGVSAGARPGAWTLAVAVSAALTFAAIRWLDRPAGGRAVLASLAAAALVVSGVAGVVLAAEDGVEAGVDREGSLLVMSGMNSHSGGGAIQEIDHPVVFGYDCEQVYYVSYTGAGPGQPQNEATCPVRTGAPYSEEDTRELSFQEQVAALAEQVAEQIPPPVTLIAHSQGAWVAWEAAAAGLLDGVETLVVVGPFPDSTLGWPAPGRPGPGRVGADTLEVLEPVTRLIGFDFHPYDAISVDVLAEANVPRSIYAQPLPDGIEALSVHGIGDLALNAGGWRIDGATDGCPVVSDHPDLPRSGEFQAQVNAFLDGEAPDLDDCPRWRTLLHPLSLPWAPPPADGEAAYDP